MKNCRVCDCLLDSPRNWYAAFERSNNRICKPCANSAATVRRRAAGIPARQYGPVTSEEDRAARAKAKAKRRYARHRDRILADKRMMTQLLHHPAVKAALAQARAELSADAAPTIGGAATINALPDLTPADALARLKDVRSSW